MNKRFYLLAMLSMCMLNCLYTVRIVFCIPVVWSIDIPEPIFGQKLSAISFQKFMSSAHAREIQNIVYYYFFIQQVLLSYHIGTYVYLLFYVYVSMRWVFISRCHCTVKLKFLWIQLNRKTYTHSLHITIYTLLFSVCI